MTFHYGLLKMLSNGDATDLFMQVCACAYTCVCNSSISLGRSHHPQGDMWEGAAPQISLLLVAESPFRTLHSHQRGPECLMPAVASQ